MQSYCISFDHSRNLRSGCAGMKRSRTFTPSPLQVIPLILLSAVSTQAGTPDASTSRDVPAAAPAAAADWLTGEGVNLGNMLFPHIHFQTAWGRTSSSLGHEQGAGHHDPVEDGWTVQGIELGMSARFTDHIEAFGSWHGFWENESPNDFDHDFEEYFLKLKDLPGGFDIRGGRYLNRFGLHNNTHLHAWDWTDNYLMNGRFLGDDGMYTTGAELTWHLPVSWTSTLSISAGDASHPEHEHEHEEEDHEEHGALFEAEGAVFDSTLYTVNWTNAWNVTDFHQWRAGASFAWGDNVWGRRTTVAGAHLEYQWREKGLERGGDYFRWRTEAMLRRASAISGHLPGEEEEDHEDEEMPVFGSFDEWGLYTSLSYGRALANGSVLEGSLRYEYVDGSSEAGLPRRHRISPGVTWHLNSLRTAYFRGQVNFDDIEDHGREESVWLSFGLNWGGAEVR